MKGKIEEFEKRIEVAEKRIEVAEKRLGVIDGRSTDRETLRSSWMGTKDTGEMGRLGDRLTAMQQQFESEIARLERENERLASKVERSATCNANVRDVSPRGMRVAAITDVDLETVQFLPLDDGACSITWSDTDGQKHQRSFTNSKDAVDFKADFLT